MATNKPAPQRPLALSLASPTAFLDYILAHHTMPTTLIICSTRSVFLQHLLTSIHHTRSPPPPSSPPSSPAPTNPSAPTAPPHPHPPPTHPILPPTLQNLTTTSKINLAFCPTLEHLRAYLSTYAGPQSPSPPSHLKPQPPTPSSNPGSRHAILALLNPLELHRSTPHFSAQGLSRTFAVAVETAAREGMRLVVGECGGCEGIVVGDDVEDDGLRREGRDGGRGGDLWEARVPLLNGTVRFGGEERVWAGRSVTCRRVVERWCVFRGKGDEGGEDC